MTTGSLVYVMTGAQVLLGKPDSLGKRHWNGLGGVVGIGDSASNVVRRACQAIGINPEISDALGEVLYHHPVHGTWRVMPFRVDNYTGQAAAVPGLEIKWFPVTNLPFEDMWPGDDLWLPQVIEGVKFQSEIWFNETDKVTNHDTQILK